MVRAYEQVKKHTNNGFEYDKALLRLDKTGFQLCFKKDERKTGILLCCFILTDLLIATSLKLSSSALMLHHNILVCSNSAPNNPKQ